MSGDVDVHQVDRVVRDLDGREDKIRLDCAVDCGQTSGCIGSGAIKDSRGNKLGLFDAETFARYGRTLAPYALYILIVGGYPTLALIINFHAR